MCQSKRAKRNGDSAFAPVAARASPFAGSNLRFRVVRWDAGMRAGQCDSCQHQRIVKSGRGGVFSLCERHRAEPERYPKYPRLPVESCPGYEDKRARETPG